MAEAYRTYFRPTVVICVGEVGKEIRDHLTPDGGRLQANARNPARYGGRLLTSLDRPLRQGVSLIQFPSEDYDDTAQSPDNIPAQCWLVDHMFQQIELLAHRALSNDGLPDEGLPDDFRLQPFEEGIPLQRIFQNALVHVQAQENLQNVAEAGFMIVNPNTQVFIVGDAESEWMGYVLQVVHSQLERFHLQSEVSFILSRYEPDSSGRVEWTTRLDWGNRLLANFNFLYENAMRESNNKATFLTREQSYYTAAEALFSFIATGMTTLDQYQQPLKLIPNLGVYEKVGNLSTSLVIFPYRAVRRFCSAQLGAELMDDWLDDINRSSVSDGERARQQERARRDVSEIENWIKDNEIRPGTEYLGEQNSSRRSRNDPARTRSRILRWPSLSILRNPAQRQRAERPFLEHERIEDRERREQREREEEAGRQDHLTRYRRLHDRTQALFEFFSYKEVKKESREHTDGPEAWAEVALGRSSRASDMIVNWSNEANQTWAAVSQRASNTVQRTVDRIWPATNNGLDLARIYIDEYDDKLTELANLLSVWRKTHRADYLSTLSEFDRLSDGPWVRNEDDPAINNSINSANVGQARPMGSNAGVSGPIVMPTSGGILTSTQPVSQLPPTIPLSPPGTPGQRQQTVGLHQHLPEREREIARRLGQRLTWEYSRVPRWPNLAAAGILAAPVMILTLLALVPSLAATPLNILSVTVGTIILVALGSWLFRRYQERNLIKIQKELLKFYSYYYANRCETREDFLRVNVMAPLRMRVSRMRERLDDMRGFILLISNRMEEAAREAHDRLFDPRFNPAAVRDVYVGNGALLQRSEWERDVPHSTPAEIRQRRVERRSRQRNRSSRNNERERQMRFEKRATNTLEDCAERIHAKRLSERRKEPWHHPADLRPALLLSFQNNPQSILEMSVEEAVFYIDRFTGPVIGAYLTDTDPDLVSIGLALDWKETWDAVFDRMERPVYLLLGSNPSAELVFICGRQQDIDSGQRYIEMRQRDYIRVDTKNPDWLLIAGFFRDSAPAALNVTRLFPLRN